MAKKLPYNTTDLDPQANFERHIFHRDMFCHYLRWSFILGKAKVGDTVVDFGCGEGPLLEVLYRNRFACKQYVGLDIRTSAILKAQEKFDKVKWADFIMVDLITTETNLDAFQADKVCSFEVMEHVGKQNGLKFLQNFKRCGRPEATYYLSTPCYNEKVGAADNHTYDSGDGRGKAPQEFTLEELRYLIHKAGFLVVERFGTFASQHHYKPIMNGWQTEMFNWLSRYYDSTMVSNMMAPMFPDHSRNCLWVLKQDPDWKEPVTHVHDEVVIPSGANMDDYIAEAANKLRDIIAYDPALDDDDDL